MAKFVSLTLISIAFDFGNFFAYNLTIMPVIPILENDCSGKFGIKVVPKEKVKCY